VPAYFCWDAKYFYRATINNINVTFDKTPLLISEKYTSKFVLTVYGLFSKTTKELTLNVKGYENTKKIKAVKPKYSERKTIKFLEIERELMKIPRPKIITKKTTIKISQSKPQKLYLKTDKIMNINFFESLQENSIFNNYQKEFINEQENKNGK
jgi:hypothetical protein